MTHWQYWQFEYPLVKLQFDRELADVKPATDALKKLKNHMPKTSKD